MFKNIFKKLNINHNKFLFYFLFNLKKKSECFKVNISTNCLVLSQYPGAEIKGLGGLIAQYPKNFEVLCFTNGSSLMKDLSPQESSNIKKQQFQEVMKMTRIKGYKIFDIDDKTLDKHYTTFRKIDISEADYIFIPNIYDSNPDTISLIEHFKEVLKEKEYKKNLKIIMFESDYPLCLADYFVNIGSIIETKKKLLTQYYPEDKFPSFAQKVAGLNAYRSIQYGYDYCEVFFSLTVEEFLNIPFV